MTVFREQLRVWLQRLEDAIAAAGSGTVGGPGSTTVNAIAAWANTAGTAIKNTLVTITAGGSIVLPSGQTVDGRDVSVDGAALDAHLANTSNPHTVTKAQVGLGSVTDDAQLKRAAGDFGSFSAATPASADVLLIEDASDSNNKKKITIADIAGASSGSYVESAQGSASTDFTTTSTTAADMPGATVTMTLTTGDILLISWDVSANLSGAGDIVVELVVDGAVVQSSRLNFTAATGGPLCGGWRASGLSAGSRTCKLQWKLSSGGPTASCNVATNAVHHAVIVVERVRV